MSEVSKNLKETSGACVNAQVRSKCGSPSDFVRDVIDMYLAWLPTPDETDQY